MGPEIMHMVHARFQSHGHSPHSWLISRPEDPFEQGRYFNRFEMEMDLIEVGMLEETIPGVRR
jgi:hypothetical protein